MSQYNQGQTLCGGHGRVMDLRKPIPQGTLHSKRSITRWTRDIGPEITGARRPLYPIVRTSHGSPTFRREIPRKKVPHVKRLSNPDDAI